MITKLIKTWEFTNDVRPYTSMSPKVRLNSEDATSPRLQLVGDPSYPTSTVEYAKTQLQEPKRVIKWLKFEHIWSSSEPDWCEYSIVLSNQAGDTFSFAAQQQIPRVGDIIYQADAQTKITNITGDVLTLESSSGVGNGLALAVRSKCNILFRIYDSTDVEWIYDIGSSAWRVAAADEWNTAYVINRHLSELNLQTFGQGIGFIINLRTSDPIHTPYVSGLQMLGQFDIEFAEDIIFDSLIPTLESGLSVTLQMNIRLTEDTDVVDMVNTYVLSNDGYNITDVEVAYNVTSDPKKITNIASSYTLGQPKLGGGYEPGYVHLNGVQSAGSVLELKLKYFPEIVVNTSKTYYEVTKHPLVVLEHIEKKSTVSSGDADKGRNFIRDKLTLTGVLSSPPEQYDLIIEYVVYTGNLTDQHRLGEAIHRFFNATNEVRSWGLDEPYPLVVGKQFRSENLPNVADVSTHVGQFKIVNVVEVIKDPENVPLVGYLSSDMTTN